MASSNANLLEWFSRLGQISGDSRQELVHAAQRHGWDVESFGRFVEGSSGDVHNCKQLREVLKPREVAGVIRAFRQDFCAKPGTAATSVAAARHHAAGYASRAEQPDPSSASTQALVPVAAPVSAGSPYAWAEFDAPQVQAVREAARQAPAAKPNGAALRSEPLSKGVDVQCDDGVGKAHRPPQGVRRYAVGSEVPKIEHGKAGNRVDAEYPEIAVMHERRHYAGAECLESEAEDAREVGRYPERRHMDEPGSDLCFVTRPPAEPKPPADWEAERRHFDQDGRLVAWEERGRPVRPPTGDAVGEAYGQVPLAEAQGADIRPQRRHYDVPGNVWPKPRAEEQALAVDTRQSVGKTGRQRRDTRNSCPEDDLPYPVATSVYDQSGEQSVIVGAYAMAVSPDGTSVYVAGTGSLARFDAASVQLRAQVPCAGGRRMAAGHATGYADVAATENCVVCVGLDGTLYIHDPVTCTLLAERAYEPTVFESTQRIVAGSLRTTKSGITGLEGGFGGASRIAVSGDAIFVGGKDGVVTALATGNLNTLARTQLSEGPQAIGVRFVCLAPSQQRVYAGVLSALHVLTPDLQSIAKLRGSSKAPVFGSFSCAAESPDGRLLFAADTKGPSIHVWDTESWQWLSRVDLAGGQWRQAGGGAAIHLVVSLDSRLLYASTEWGRFLAFDASSLPPRCVEEGGGGGALAVGSEYPEYAYVLTQGRVVLRKPER